MELKRSNSKAFETIRAQLSQLEGKETRVGWFESAQYEDGTPVAYIAAIQEQGSGPIPPRSFFRTTVLEKKQTWIDTVEKLAKLVIGGKINGRDMMDMLGLQIEGDVQKKIASITTPPLSPLTLAARKYRQQGKSVTGKTLGELSRKLKDGTIDVSGVSTKPLNDTGQMIATLTHVVEET